MSDTERLSPWRLLVVLAAVVVVIAGTKAAASILVPFLCAAFLAILCLPGLQGMTRRGIPQPLALTAVLLGLVLLALVVLTVIGSSLANFQDHLGEYRANVKQLQDSVVAWLGEHGVQASEDTTQAFDIDAVLGFVGQAVGQISGLMGSTFIILLMLAFLLGELGCLQDKVRFLAKDADTASARVKEITTSISRYFSIKIWVSLGTGVSVTVLLKVLGVDFPFLWGFIAFLLNFVPNIGSILAGVPPVLVALVQTSGGIGMATWVVAGFVLINVVFGSVLEPRLMGRRLDLSTLVVLLSLLFWGWVLGPVGMILSVPLTIVVKIALEAFPETRGIALMLGSEVPGPEGGPGT